MSHKHQLPVPMKAARRRHLTGLPLPRVDPPPSDAVYSVFDYGADHLEERPKLDAAACVAYHKNRRTTWINVDGLIREEVERLCKCYDVHQLVIEDILSRNERAKLDDTTNVIFCVLPMMYFNEGEGTVEREQVSIVLGPDFVLSFQEEASRDVFDPVRRRLRDKTSQLRQRPADFLCYTLVDLIVDSYFAVLDQLGDYIEELEDDLLARKTKRAMDRISNLRREVMIIHRNIQPVRELVSGFVRSDSPLLEDRHDKYYRDVLDHIIQANEHTDNHRDMLMNLQDLYLNQINLRMNEVMKTLTIVTTLLAPATVVGGIFGMNFDVIPASHHQYGFWIAIGIMFGLGALMLLFFKRKQWF